MAVRCANAVLRAASFAPWPLAVPIFKARFDLRLEGGRDRWPGRQVPAQGRPSDLARSAADGWLHKRQFVNEHEESVSEPGSPDSWCRPARPSTWSHRV